MQLNYNSINFRNYLEVKHIVEYDARMIGWFG